MIKKFAFLLFALLSICINAQLAAFTVTATKVSDETCPNNGAISWTTSGTTAGSTLTYSLINADTNEVVTTLSTTSYNSLPAGKYKIVATQSLGTNSNQATSATITILNKVKPLVFTITKNSDEICGSDGEITVNVTSGTPPYQYEIIDASTGDVILSQESNVFKNLKAGNIRVRVIDACGTGVVNDISLSKLTSSISKIEYRQGTPSADCKSITFRDLRLEYPSGSDIKLPIRVDVTYTNPDSGVEETITNTYTEFKGGNESARLKVTDGITLPYFKDNLPTKVTVKDGCGNVFNFDYTFNLAFNPSTVKSNGACGKEYISFSGDTGQDGVNFPFKITYISGPDGFDPTTYDPNYGQFLTSHQWGSEDNPLPPGNYLVKLETQCGVVIEKKFIIGLTNPRIITNYFPTCENDLGAFKVYISTAGFTYHEVKMVSAPAAYTGALPYTLPDSNFATGQYGPRTIFFLDDLPAGTYKFEYNFTCDSTIKTITVTVPPTKKDSTKINITSVDCSSINYDYTLGFGSNDFKTSEIIGLQRYYPEKDDWSDVTKYVAPNQSRPVVYTKYFDGKNTSGSNTINNLDPAKYRFIIYYEAAFSNNDKRPCYMFLDTVDLGAELVFENAYAFQCSTGNYDVAIVASKGIDKNLNYSIVSDGSGTAEVVKDNGTDPLFTNLEPGEYFFRVSDVCGNFITRKLDVAFLGKPGIKTVVDCSTSPGSVQLVVNGVDYLKFEWTKDTDPTVLSTSSTLDLGPFDASKAGTYKVRMYSDDGTSCIDTTEEIQISPDALTDPKSGVPVQPQPAIINYDSNQPKVDLFDFLQEGTYDGFGEWTETTAAEPSNVLVDNQWNVYAAKGGTYTFRYTVKALCGDTVSSTDITIQLIKYCYKLPAKTGGDALETKVGITSLGRAGAVAAKEESWPMVRKGGWMALESNTKGFVVNRVAFDSNNKPVGIATDKFVEGMMVFDTTNKCLKIYNGTIWSCFTSRTCPE